MRFPVSGWSLDRSVARFGWRGATSVEDDGPHYFLAFATEDDVYVGVRLHQDGPDLVIACDDSMSRTALFQVLRMLSVAWSEDTAGFESIGQRDPVVERLQAVYEGVRPIGVPSVFEAAVETVIREGLPGSIGAAVRQRVAETLGEAVRIDGRVQFAFPAPERLVDDSVLEGLRGLNGQRDSVVAKRRQIAELARACVARTLDGPTLRAWDGALAARHVAGIADLGPVAAERIVMLGAHHRDVLQSRTNRVAEQMERAYGLRPGDADAAEDVARVWAPYRSWVSALMLCARRDAM
jgi:3-methyladenine DNA glycosylase/8-oxoguanine DNA glycosylase